MPVDGLSVAELIRASGWRQGSFVRRDDANALLHSAVDHTELPVQEPLRLVVISQDCDLVAESIVEPFVELIGSEEISRPDPLCQYGRNPRRLDIDIFEAPASQRWIGISIHDRFRVRKEVLSDLAADETVSISGENVRLLSRWIAKRYTRPAFPDQFNARLDVVGKRLEKLAKSAVAEAVTGIFLDVVDDELPEEQPYTISIRITAKAAAYEDEELRRGLDEFEERFSLIVDACPGIEIHQDDIRHMPEEDLTLADLRWLRRFDRDYRSLPEQDGVAQPVDPSGAL